MIKRKIAVLMLCGILCITGCSQNRKADAEKGSTFAQEGMTEAATSVVDFNEYDALFSNAKDTNIYDEEYVGGGVTAGLGAVTPADSALIYNGEALQLEFSGETGWDTTFGCLIYINGIPQKYHTDISEEELYLHAVPSEKDKEKKVTLFIHPNTGKAGEELDMAIVSVLSAGYRPLGPHDTLWPEGHARLSGWYKVKMEADAAGSDSPAVSVIDKLTNYTDYELSKLIYTNPDGSLHNSLEYAGFKSMHHRTIIEDKKLHLFTQFGGGEENVAYMISAYLNGRVLKTWQLTLKDYKSRAVIDEVFTFTDEMLEEYDVSDYNSYYYIAVPLNKKTDTSQSSRGIVVSGKEVLQ